MAVYPSIYWDKATSKSRRMGLDVSEMMDGSPHVQSYFLSGQAQFRVSHALLTQAEVDTIVAFLESFIGADIDIVEPSSGQTYRGKQVGDINIPYDGDVHHKLSWEFSGRRV